MMAKSATFLAVVFSFVLFLILSNNSNAQTDPAPYSVQGDSPVKASIDVASNTGAASSSILIEVPPGRNGIAPKLALTYSSNTGNGVAGVGWGLSLGEIQRSTKKGLNYGACDFVFGMGGSAIELVFSGDCTQTNVGYYEEQIERTFSRYYFDGNGWVVTTKDGTKYYYGTSLSSRQTNSNGTFKWALENVQDTNGNYMVIQYTTYNNDGEIYLNRIDYTGNNNSPTLSPSNSVQFYYEARTDAPPMYMTNAEVRTSQRLQKIEIAANGTWARKYEFDYCPDNVPGCYSSSTKRSLLGHISQYGWDTNLNPAAWTGYPRTTKFEWAQPPDAITQTWQTPSLNGNLANGSVQPIMGDVNADVKTDIVQIERYLDELVDSTQIVPYLWNGANFVSGSTMTLNADEFWYGNFAHQWLMGDIDGDGKTDLVLEKAAYGTEGGADVHGLVFYQSNGSGYAEAWRNNSFLTSSNQLDWRMIDIDGDWKSELIGIEHSYWINDGTVATESLTVYRWNGAGFVMSWYSGWLSGPWANRHTLAWLIGEVNGDDKTDLIQVYDNNGALGMAVLLSNGTGFDQSWSNDNVGASSQALAWLVGDINGDGKIDVIRPQDNSGTLAMSVYLSNGTGFVESPANASMSNMGQTPKTVAWYALDMNGDGKTDIVHLRNNNWVLGMTLYLSDGSGLRNAWISDNMNFGVFTKGLTGDVQGDGKNDIILYSADFNGGYTYPTVFSQVGPVPDLLTKITNTFGGSTNINYEPSTAYSGAHNCPGHKLPFVVQTVSSISVNDDNGNVSSTIYDYECGHYSVAEREFRGFENMVIIDSSNTRNKSWFFTTDDTYKGMPYKQVVIDASANIYTWTENTYGNRSLSGGIKFPYLTQKDDYVCDGLATFNNGPGTCKYARVTLADADYDAYGNVLHKHYDGDVAVSGDERDEYTEYYYDTNNWIVSLPFRTYIKDSTGTLKAQTWFDYYSTGNLWKKTSWLTGDKTNTLNPVTEYTYYNNGNLQTVKDPEFNVPTTYEYDTATSTFVWKATVTNPDTGISLVTQKVYDYRFGKVKDEWDPNGGHSEYWYDAFGRSLDADDHHISTQQAYAEKETYYDGMGRTIKTRTPGPASGQHIVTETIYNDKGQVWRTSLPYFEADGRPACLSNPSIFNGCTTYYYDPIGRVMDVQNPDGTAVTKVYNQGRTTMIDASDHAKVEEKDVYGRLIKVEEYTGTYPNAVLYATTSYSYDVLGNLKTVTDAKGNLTTINYDSLSRKINMNDPDMGYWQYWYDKNGNLTYQTDAKGQSVQFTYDRLNRIKNKHYVSCTTCTDVDYTYDTDQASCSIPNLNPLGRLTKVTDASGSEKYCYDDLGRAVKTIKTVDGVDYSIQTTLDELGRTASLTYPDGEIVGFDYDAAGNLTSAGGYAVFSGFNALGQASSVTYGNGITTTYEYYSATDQSQWLNRLKSIKTGPGNTLQNLTYTYYDNANIHTINDGIDSSRSQTFTYDDLNRLRFATSAVYGTLEYRYNEIGNMTYNSRVSASNYTYWKDVFGTKPHAVYQAGSNTYHYDANGNMDVRNGVNITYDYDNRPTGMGSSSFVYDFSGLRVKKNGTVYIGELYECNGGNCIKYIFAGSTRIASQSSNKTYFYHSDHLGSSSVITDEKGSKAQETYYYPFGEVRYNSGNATHFKFTGQEYDDETGLYYYGARYYDPVVGRFISPDTIVQAPFNPQTLNRYSYCVNNPLIYTDPSGHFFLIDDIIVAAVTYIAANAAVIAEGAAIGAVLGGTSAAITGGNILQGMALGAVSGAVFAGVGGAVGSGVTSALEESAQMCSQAFATAGQVAGGITGGAAAGASVAALGGGNVGQGALVGGISGGLGSFGTPSINLFGNTPVGAIGNRLFNSAVTGVVFGGAYAGVTGGNIGQGMGYGAMGWAVGDAANMLIGNAVGFIGSGFKAPEFRNGMFVYGGNPGGHLTIGNAIWASPAGMSPSEFAHESGHGLFQGKLLGPSYLPAHLFDKATFSLMLEYSSGLLGGAPTYYDLYPADRRPWTWW